MDPFKNFHQTTMMVDLEDYVIDYCSDCKTHHSILQGCPDDYIELGGE